VLLDEGIDLVFALGGEAVEVVGKAAGLVVDIFARVPEEGCDLFWLLLAEVALEEHLHGQFTGLAAGSH
jgi:hypothetical protein